MRAIIRKLISIQCLLLFVLAVPLGAQIEWTRYGTADYNWTDTSNWLDGVAPEADETQDIVIKAMAGISSFTPLNIYLDTDGDQVLKGNLLFQFATNRRYQPVLHLQGKSLIMEGGVFGILSDSGTPEQAVDIHDGTVVLGVAGGASASLNLGYAQVPSGAAAAPEVYMTFREGATLNTANADTIRLAYNGFNSVQRYLLDLSAAGIRTGDEIGKLKANNIELGGFLSTARTGGRDSEGTIVFGNSLQVLEVVQDLILGNNQKTNGANANMQGVLEFTSGLEGERTLIIGRSLIMGMGDRGIGEIKNAPAGLNLYIGDENTPDGERGDVIIAYNHINQNSSNSGATTGTFVGGEGEVKIYASMMRIGQRTSNFGATTNGSATGILDLRNADLVILDVANDVIIGEGLNGRGEVRLKGGEATSKNLYVGRASGETTERSLLDLNGTHWVVEQTLEIGALGDVVARATATGGLDIIGTLSILTGGKLSVLFNGLGNLWGVRIEGDYTELLGQYLDDGRLEGLGTYAAFAEIFEKEGYTYYGIQTIPEPETVALLMATMIGAVVWINRRRVA